MSQDARDLNAAQVLYPGRGEVLTVETGSALVFAEEVSGRRAPLLTLAAGESLVGCGPRADGVRMLVTGLPGTRVRLRALADDDDPAALLAWAVRLTDSAADAAWPARILPASQAASMVSPGEHISTDEEAPQWVQLRRGRATLCSSPQAAVDSGGDPVLLTRNSWLTSGLRMRLEVVPSPVGPQQWGGSLDRIARLACGAALDRQVSRDAENFARSELRQRFSDVATREAVDVLADSVGGSLHVPEVADAEQSAWVAATIIVAKASGLPLNIRNLSRISEQVSTGLDPTAAVAGACQARIRPVSLAPGWWQEEGSPSVVEVSGESESAERSPAAVIWQSGRWILMDPVTEDKTEVTEQVARRIHQQATQLLPILPDSPTDLAALGRLTVSGNRREIAVILGITAAVGAASFITPYLLGQLASLFTAFAPASAFVGVFVALFLVILGLLGWQAVRSLSLLRLRARASAVGTSAMWERTMRQPAPWHASEPLGYRVAYATSVNNASAAVPDEVVIRMLDVVIVLGSLGAIATTNSTILMWLVVLLIVQLAITVALLRVAAGHATRRMATSADASGLLIETLGAVNGLRVAGAESRAFLRWARAQALFTRADQQLRQVTMLQGLVIAVWPILGLVVVVAATSASGGSFGEFVTAQTAVTAATAAVAGLALASNAAVVAGKALRQAEPVLISPPESNTTGAVPGVLSGGIEMRNIVFRYAPDRPAVLDHVNLTVTPGEQLAIVGPSGCGKTTLMRILLGLEQPESGVITLDGRNLASLDAAAVRRQIGSVLQSSTLLPATIRDNVAMGRQLTQSQIWAALEAAAVADDVKSLAMGLDMPVTDGGGTLSGGQRQRILIARALASDPRMLVLDEATSALDNVTQASVVASLQQLRITRVLVAHRLSTIREADRIVVMSAGRVVDEGTFDELMSRPGPFRELAARQEL